MTCHPAVWVSGLA